MLGAVGEREDVVWHGVHGLAVLDPPTPITSETVFHVASVAKQFTAQPAALLVAEGRLSLEDTVADHLDPGRDAVSAPSVGGVYGTGVVL